MASKILPTAQLPIACDHCEAPLGAHEFTPGTGSNWVRSWREFPFASLPYVLCSRCSNLKSEGKPDRGGKRVDPVLACFRRATRFGASWGKAVEREFLAWLNSQSSTKPEQREEAHS
jgi:hypothetical protein